MFKRKKSSIIILVSIEVLMLLYSWLFHWNPIMPLYQFFYSDLDKLTVHFQATTGPSHYLKEDIDVLKKLEINQYANLSSSEIDLVGNTDFEFEEFSLTGDKVTLVYGKLIGVSKAWENTPVFKVYYYKPINYMFNGAAPIIILIYQFFIFYIIFSKCIIKIKHFKK